MSCNCGCHDNDPLMPKVAVITNIRRDTPDVTTFRIENPEGESLSISCQDNVL